MTAKIFTPEIEEKILDFLGTFMFEVYCREVRLKIVAGVKEIVPGALVAIVFNTKTNGLKVSIAKDEETVLCELIHQEWKP